MAFIYFEKSATHCYSWEFGEDDIGAFVSGSFMFLFASHESGHITTLAKLYSTTVKVSWMHGLCQEVQNMVVLHLSRCSFN